MIMIMIIIIIMMMMMMTMMMMIMTMIIIMIIIIIMMMIMIIRIIAFKGAFRDFLQSPQCSANYLQHLRSSSPGAIVCKSHATRGTFITCNMSCNVPRGKKRQFR